MAYIKKVKNTYYLRWRSYHDGVEKINLKSLGTRYKDVAQRKLVQLQKLHDLGEIDFDHPDFNPAEALREDKPITQVLTVRNAVDSFYNAKKSFWSAQTLKTNQNVLEYWIRSQNLESISIRKVNEGYFRHVLQRLDIKATTKHYYYRHFKSFWTYLVESKIVLKDIVTPLRKELPNKRDNTRPKMLTIEEFDLLVKTFELDQAQKRAKYKYNDDLVQDWFLPIVAILFYAGLRRSEVAYQIRIEYSGLKGKNLIYEKGKLEFIALPPTKGKTERIIPISATLKKYLDPYLKKRGVINPDDYVFVYSGGAYAGMAVRARKVYEVFKKILNIAGIPHTRTLHGMRHRAVTNWIEQGFHTAEAKIMAGHSSVTVTEGYTHLTAKRLKEKMDSL
ncbi:MAG: site-specific integrase [Balneolales bacterium]|nr:site-specific integrase [Balneolales bacterium]